MRSAREIAISAMKARGERAREREEIARVARQLATMDAQVSLVNCLLIASDCQARQLATMDAQVSFVNCLLIASDCQLATMDAQVSAAS